MNVTRIPKILPIALALATFAALAATPRPTSTPTSTPKPSPEWLGKSPDAVLAKFGRPDDYTIGAGVLELVYKGKAGKTGKFAFAGDVAFAVPDAKFVLARHRALPKNDIYPGQPVAEAIKILGPAKTYSFGQSSVSAHYADGEQVTMVGGRVYPN